ncbi:DNA-binding response regulator [Actinokineospora enzanensis]|uniref:DNA-binding response regulator n=1 Tax=Actinokineospora enzanensis TaxID=155975 RepID=UPI000371C853|nr:response regulator [Actinokineospora enzanensis]
MDQRVITVVVVDDHPVTRAGVATWLAAADPPIRLVAAGASAAVAWVPPGGAADVVVFDLMLVGGIPAYRELTQLVANGRRVVVYSQRTDEESALRCLEIGASTYMTKGESEDYLVEAIRAAAADRPFVSPTLAGAMAADHADNRPRLSPREKEILLAWFRSSSKAMVARQKGLRESSVNSFIERARIKYAEVGRDAPTKADLVKRALEDGLISLEDLDRPAGK